MKIFLPLMNGTILLLCLIKGISDGEHLLSFLLFCLLSVVMLVPLFLKKAPSGNSGRKRMFKKFKRNKSALFGLCVLLLILYLAILAPFVAPYDPDQIDYAAFAAKPNAQHWFGTDAVGRDVFDRVIVGTRISFLVGFSVTAISSVVGITIGLIAGYNRILDNVLMRVVDAFLAFPTILLALALIALFGPGLVNVILALSVTGAASKVRLVRSQVLSLRESTYVEAARVAGAHPLRIIVTHILPNTLGVVIVLATFTLASAMLAEAGLSFLGAGVPSYIPSWGNIIANGEPHVQVAPWISLFPGVFLTLSVLGVVLIGDALRDFLDPKLRGQLESTQGSTGQPG